VEGKRGRQLQRVGRDPSSSSATMGAMAGAVAHLEITRVTNDQAHIAVGASVSSSDSDGDGYGYGDARHASLGVPRPTDDGTGNSSMSLAGRRSRSKRE